MAKKPLILVILDGFGDSKEEYANAIVAAKTPNIDKIFKNDIKIIELPKFLDARGNLSCTGSISPDACPFIRINQ